LLGGRIIVSNNTAASGIKSFAFHSVGDALRGNRGLTPLANSDILSAVVQTIKKGGEQELHSHAATDGLYFILSGHVRFRGEDGEVIVGPHEGVFVPRGTPYSFETAGDGPAEILQFGAADPRARDTFTPYSKAAGEAVNFEMFEPEGTPLGDYRFDPLRR
jgi:mannose-6-phosphate isomerase-like protein (cupin superfamily)